MKNFQDWKLELQKIGWNLTQRISPWELAEHPKSEIWTIVFSLARGQGPEWSVAKAFDCDLIDQFRGDKVYLVRLMCEMMLFDLSQSVATGERIKW